MAARNFKYATTFLTPTIHSFTSEQADWPATNARIDIAPKRPWKTDAKTSNQDLVFNFTTPTTVQAIFINRVNYPAILVQGSNDNASYTTITPTGYGSGVSGLTISYDPDLVPTNVNTARRKILVDTTGLFTYQYLRLRIAANLTTDDSAPYYSTGAVTIAGTFNQMPHYPNFPLTLRYPPAESIVEYPSNGLQVNQDGDRHAIIEFGGIHIDDVAVSHIRAIDKVGRGPVLFYPNIREGGQAADAFDPSKAYLAWNMTPPERSYSDIPEVFVRNHVFKEVV